MNKLFAGGAESSGDDEKDKDKGNTNNFSAKLNKAERKAAKKKSGKDKITVMPRVLSGGVTAASMPILKGSKQIKKAG